MLTNYASIYLSPHLDDVALSCGGQICEQTAAGKTVLVVTIMAGDPVMPTLSDYVQSLHHRWELSVDAVAMRRAEDIAAGRILGADTLHWTVPDCIYRYHPDSGEPFYLSDDDIFGAIHPAEVELVSDLARLMEGLPTHDRLFVPLTVGHHVDHQLTRSAAELCFGTDTLYYYEDYPYVQEPGALETVIPANMAGWQPQVIPLAEAALQTKINAIAAFRSQLSTFFSSLHDLEQQVRNYAALVDGERIWRPHTSKC